MLIIGKRGVGYAETLYNLCKSKTVVKKQSLFSKKCSTIVLLKSVNGFLLF